PKSCSLLARPQRRTGPRLSRWPPRAQPPRDILRESDDSRRCGDGKRSPPTLKSSPSAAKSPKTASHSTLYFAIHPRKWRLLSKNLSPPALQKRVFGCSRES